MHHHHQHGHLVFTAAGGRRWELRLCDVIIVVGMKSDSRRYHRSDRNDVESSQTTIRKCHPVVGLFATGGGLTVAPTGFLGMRIGIPMVIRQKLVQKERIKLIHRRTTPLSK